MGTSSCASTGWNHGKVPIQPCTGSRHDFLKPWLLSLVLSLKSEYFFHPSPSAPLFDINSVPLMVLQNKGYGAYIVCDNAPLTEYAITQEDETTVSCFVCSETGKVSLNSPSLKSQSVNHGLSPELQNSLWRLRLYRKHGWSCFSGWKAVQIRHVLGRRETSWLRLFTIWHAWFQSRISLGCRWHQSLRIPKCHNHRWLFIPL